MWKEVTKCVSLVHTPLLAEVKVCVESWFFRLTWPYISPPFWGLCGFPATPHQSCLGWKSYCLWLPRHLYLTWSESSADWTDGPRQAWGSVAGSRQLYLGLQKRATASPF